MVLTDASIWLPILFCHFFIKFPNSHRLSWAQAPPGQLQVFLSRFSALFVQRLKILWQSHLTWSTAGVSSQKRARALSLLIKILDLEISLIQTKIHSLMLSSNSFPTTHTHTQIKYQTRTSDHSIPFRGRNFFLVKHPLTLLTEYMW